MFLRVPFSVLVVSLLLAHSASAAPCSGGDCSGGGSSYQGQLLDRQAKENTLRWFTDLPETQKLRTLCSSLVTRLPEFGDRCNEFFFSGSTQQRFILVDQLPKEAAADLKHEVADQLVGLQRGPNVWVLRSFHAGASPDERTAFFVHEFLVHEKLQKGPLTKVDMDEVINVTASLTEQLASSAFGEGPTLQTMLEKNHFSPGMTKTEDDEFFLLVKKFNSAIQDACSADRKVAVPAQKQFRTALKLMEMKRTDELLSPSARATYADTVGELMKMLKGNYSLKNICALNQQAKELDQLDLQVKEKVKQGWTFEKDTEEGRAASSTEAK